jgi:hypothetical protein
MLFNGGLAYIFMSAEQIFRLFLIFFINYSIGYHDWSENVSAINGISQGP